MKIILFVLGVLLLGFGLLFVGQGTGTVLWPASSFMLAKSEWAARGAIMAVGGILLLLLARRR